MPATLPPLSNGRPCCRALQSGQLCCLQIKNAAAASNAALQHDVAALQRETQEMQSKLEQTVQSFDTVQQEAQAVEGEVVDEVRLLLSCKHLLCMPRLLS